MADKKVIAVTVIHRTLAPGEPGDKSKGIAAKAPKVQVIQPKTVFLASNDAREGFDQSEYAELKASGAIRDPDSDEKVEVSVENLVVDEAGSKTTKTKTASTKAPAKTVTGTKAGENTGAGDNTGETNTGDQGAGDNAGNDLV